MCSCLDVFHSMVASRRVLFSGILWWRVMLVFSRVFQCLGVDANHVACQMSYGMFLFPQLPEAADAGDDGTD